MRSWHVSRAIETAIGFLDSLPRLLSRSLNANAMQLSHPVLHHERTTWVIPERRHLRALDRCTASTITTTTFCHAYNLRRDSAESPRSTSQSDQKSFPRESITKAVVSFVIALNDVWNPQCFEHQISRISQPPRSVENCILRDLGTNEQPSPRSASTIRSEEGPLLLNPFAPNQCCTWHPFPVLSTL